MRSSLRHRLLAFAIATAWALGAGCINPVRNGYPDLVDACHGPLECAGPYDCNDGGCEIVGCQDSTSCTFKPGLACLGGQCLEAFDGG